MAEIIRITNLTPGKVTFSFRNNSYVVGGEASYDSSPKEPDYSIFTSHFEKENEPGQPVKFSAHDLDLIASGLRKEMTDRNMTVEFLP